MATKTKPTNRIKIDNENGAAQEPKIERLTITPPKMGILTLTIRGTAPLVMNRFPVKAIQQIKEKQMAGPQGKKGRQREAKDFQQMYEEAKHISKEGWIGIPAPAFRNAMVDACRLVGFKMTHAKLGVFCLADGLDRLDNTPLVKITRGEPHYTEHCVRLESGVADIHARPMWEVGWEAVVRMQYDADMFTAGDIANLMARVGVQVGLLEGRPFSKNSCGQGWGTFELVN